MDLRSGRVMMDPNTGEEQGNSSMLGQSDVAPVQPFDPAMFMQQLQLMNVNLEQRIIQSTMETKQASIEINNKIDQSTAEMNKNLNKTNNKIDQLHVTLSNDIDLIRKENKNLKDQIELTNLTLNKKIDSIVRNVEYEIVSKVNVDLDNRVEKLQKQVETNINTNTEQIEGKIIKINREIEGRIEEIDIQYAANLDFLNKKLDEENENLKSQIVKINREKSVQYVCNESLQYETKFKLGDLVTVKSLRRTDFKKKVCAKLQLPYEDPFQISRLLRENIYELYDPKRKLMKGKFHINLISPYISEKMSDVRSSKVV